MNHSRNTLIAGIALMLMVMGSVAVVTWSDDGYDVDAATVEYDISGEVGVELSVHIPIFRTTSTVEANRTFTVSSSDLDEELGLKVSSHSEKLNADYQVYLDITGKPDKICDTTYTITGSAPRVGSYTITGDIVITGATSVIIRGDSTFPYDSSILTKTYDALVQPIDTAVKDLRWYIVNESDETRKVATIGESHATDYGSTMTLNIKGPGSVTICAAINNGSSVAGTLTINILDSVIIIGDIDGEIPAGGLFTKTINTQPEDATITIDEVKLDGVTQYNYAAYLTIDGKTIKLRAEEVGTYEIFFTASAENYGSASGTLTVISSEVDEDVEPAISSITAELRPGYDRTWDFIAYGIPPNAIIQWDFGDGTIENGGTSRTHQFPEEKPYIVTVTVSNLAGDSVSKSVPIVATGVEPSDTANIDQPYVWYTYYGSTKPVLTFDDGGATWLKAEPTEEADGWYIYVSGTPTEDVVGKIDREITYKVSLQTSTGVGKEWEITLYPKGIGTTSSSFTVLPDSVDPMVAVVTYTGSLNQITINWGDGTTPQVINKIGDGVFEHIYGSEGTWTITITTRSNTGGEDSVTPKQFESKHAEGVDVTIGDIEDMFRKPGESFEIVLDINMSSVAISTNYDWITVDGKTLKGNVPDEIGDYDVTVKVIYGTGNEDTAEFTITVNEGGVKPVDPEEDEPDWVMFAMMTILMIVLMFAFYYYGATVLIFVPLVGIVISAWYMGVIDWLI